MFHLHKKIMPDAHFVDLFLCLALSGRQCCARQMCPQEVWTPSSARCRIRGTTLNFQTLSGWNYILLAASK